MKRETYMRGPLKTYHSADPLTEAAKFLATQARRFAQGKGNASDVEVGITEWRAALADAHTKRGEKP